MEKSSSFSRSNNSNDANNIDTDIQTDATIESSPQIVEDQNKEDDSDVTEAKEELNDGEATTDDNNVDKNEDDAQEVEEAPPEIQHTLESLSEDIDRYILDLLSSPPLNYENIDNNDIVENEKGNEEEEEPGKDDVNEKGKSEGEEKEKEEEKENSEDQKKNDVDENEGKDTDEAKEAEKEKNEESEVEKEKDNENEIEKKEETETETETETEIEKEKEEETETETEIGKEENVSENEKVTVQLPEFVDKFLDLVEEIIAKHDTEDEKVFYESVDRISKLLNSLLVFKSEAGPVSMVINRVSIIKQSAMAYLEDKFRSLLEDYTNSESPQETKGSGGGGVGDEAKEESEATTEQDTENANEEEFNNFPRYSSETLSTLRNIATQLVKGGYEDECREIYMVARRNALEEILNQDLAYEKLSIEEVQKMHWETLEREIPTWIRTCKDCTTVLFPSEFKIAGEVFADINNPLIAHELFERIARALVIQLISFAEAMAMTKRSTEKLFKVLDMYETLRDYSPAVGTLFPEETANDLKAEAFTARCRLGETAICIFCDLENSIKSDTGKTPVPGGAVHPLTRYTMNYLKYACEYNATLEQVFREHSKIERADSTDRPNFEPDPRNFDHNKNLSPFACQMTRVMDLLDVNLEAKAKLYKDIALSNIFMMNNGRYVLQKIKGAKEIHQVMGDTWCRRKSTDLRNYHKNYQRETWGKLLSCLTQEGLNVHGKVPKPVLKERFKSFNATFDEIHKTQSTWVVSDEQLQSELRVSISAVVIPAYRAFLGRFAQVLDPGRQTEKYIKFQSEDIETYIDELFDGNSAMKRKQ